MIQQSQNRPKPERSQGRSWPEEVRLPGGLCTGEGLERVARMKPVTGCLEHELAEIAESGRPLPERVSAVLSAAVERVGGVALDQASAAALCVADRRYLMLALTAWLGSDVVWLTPACAVCKAPFDVRVSLAELPLKPASPGYPFVDVNAAGVCVRVRVPTGADQARIVELPSERARVELLAGCIVSLDDGREVGEFMAQLSDEQMVAIDAALDDAAPDVGTLLDAACPECGARQVVSLDPYDAGLLDCRGLYEEVHTLASHYHWAEADILKLPRERRHRYLRLIERAKGVHS